MRKLTLRRLVVKGHEQILRTKIRGAENGEAHKMEAILPNMLTAESSTRV